MVINKKNFPFLLFFISFSVFLSLERLCHLATDGFSMIRISHTLCKDPPFNPPFLDTKELSQLKKITSQPFHYLSCGGQSYVFVSDDDEYVLKLLKFHHRRVAPWFYLIPLSKSYKTNKIKRKEERLKRTLKSYVIAYTELKEETGLIYHHLQETSSLNQSLLFYDKIGNPHKIDLDQYAFLIQKKGKSTDAMLKILDDKKDYQQAKKLLNDLIILSINRSKKGIKDRDFKFKSNLGFIDGKASQIDLGSLLFDETQKLPEVYEKEILHSGIVFYEYLQKNYPLLADPFYQELCSLKNKAY